MSPTHRAFLSILSLILSLVTAFSSPRFHVLTVSDGLPSSYIASITMDSYGIMWFGTNSGLCRYDGYTFRSYLVDEPMTFHYVDKVMTAADGTVWCTCDGQIYYYDRESDTMENDFSGFLKDCGFPTDIGFRSFTIDQEGNIWFMERETTCKYDFASGKGTIIKGTDERILNAQSKSRKTYILYADGSIRHEGKVLTRLDCREVGQLQMFIDSSDYLWVFSYTERILTRIDTKDGSVSDFSESTVLDEGFVRGMADASEGKIWIAKDSGGLIEADYNFEKITLIERGSGKDFSLPYNHLLCLYCTPDGLLWVGYKKGVAYRTSEDVDMETLILDTAEDVTSIFQDSNGDYIFLLDGNGLIRYDKASGRMKHLTMDNSDIPNNTLLDAVKGKDGRIWISTYGSGVFYLKDGKVHFPECNDPEFSYIVRNCKGLSTDNDGNLWIRTYANGICCLCTDGTWKHYRSERSSWDLRNATDVLVDSKSNRVYVGTNSGLYFISADRREVSKTEISGKVTDIFCDSRNYVWVGCDDILYVINSDNKCIGRIDLANNYSNSYIKSICEDSYGNIWVASDNWLSDIVVVEDPVTDVPVFRVFPYYANDGIGNVVFNRSASFSDSDGNMLFGCDNSVLFVHTMNKHTVSDSRAVLFMSFRDPYKGTWKNLESTDVVTVKYSDSFTIDISLLDYPNLHRVAYEYAIDDKGWVEANGNRLFLNNLTPGKHILKVKVGGPFHSETPESSLILKVTPPFWRSWVAYIVYFILLSVIMSMIQLTIRDSQRRKIEIERNELNEAKLKFLSNISHDLRTPLALVITPLGKLIKDHDGEKIADDLRNIYRHSQSLMTQVNQLLDFRRLDYAVADFNPTYGDIARFTKDECASFNILFSDGSLSFDVQIDDKDILTDFDKEKYQKILFNLLTNANKYNRPGGSVTVKVEKASEDIVRISVADTGIGIKDENKEKVFDRFFQEKHGPSSVTGKGIGLNIVKEYVHLHGGTINVTDNEPCGSVFTIQLPITDKTKNNLSVPELEGVASITGSRPVLLVVEDNEEFRKFLCESLSANYDTVPASDGEMALVLLDRYSFDVIISDVMMPNVDGLQLCNKVKSDIRYSHIPVVLLSALSDQSNALKGLREGADEYIGKPFDMDILLLKLSKLIDRTKENRLRFLSSGGNPEDYTFSKLDRKLMEDLIRIVDENLTNSEYSVDDLSKDIGMSRSGLYKKVNYITGKAPIEFIRLQRLKKAKELMDSGETYVSQISWSVGISPKLFSKYFKDEFGCLPSEYLKTIRK